MDKLAQLAKEIEAKKNQKSERPTTPDGRYYWDEFYRVAAFNQPVSG